MTAPATALRAWSAAEAGARQVVARDGLPIEVREGEAVSRYEWRAGQLVAIVEPSGRRWSYGYGADGRLLSVHRDERPWASYTYDDAGRLARVVRPEGSFEHGYDGAGRLVRTLRGDGSPRLYRWVGDRVVEARTDRERSCFSYDAAGRLAGLEQTFDDCRLRVGFVFDDAGRLARIEYPEWRQVLSFAWDERGRPASVGWNGRTLVRFGTDDAVRAAWAEDESGVREETRSEVRPTRQVVTHQGRTLWSADLERDDSFRLVREGARRHAYDAAGRLAEVRDGDRAWRYAYTPDDEPLGEGGRPLELERDAAGRVRLARQGGRERVFRYNDAGELVEALVDGVCVARCTYDHKGRLLAKKTAAGTERYLYRADDGLLAIADGDGRPLSLYVRMPTGIVGLVDFRGAPAGRFVRLVSDVHGGLLFAATSDGGLWGPYLREPFGAPESSPPGAPVPHLHQGRAYHAELGLYPVGARWYDPSLRQFLTPDSYTGAPDDERLVHPLRPAREQRLARAAVLGEWLRSPRVRHRFTYCANDPVNRFDPDGHWSFGGTLLSLLGVLWTLPNTALGLALEVSCLLGEVVRWLVSLLSGGRVSWQTPGFDVATSSRLDAFALVFEGGWLGSFDTVLGLTFGNVLFVNREYQKSPFWRALPDPVAPPAFNGAVTLPRSQALYEHELRHVNQYGWWGPLFIVGAPIWGIYEWDLIFNGYQNSGFERSARDHGGM